jgi:hypothetical protein
MYKEEIPIIGKIIKPKNLGWLTDEKIQIYLEAQGWEHLENAVIDGNIWTQYLSKFDYKNVYLKNINYPSIKEDIIKQIINQLSKNN